MNRDPGAAGGASGAGEAPPQGGAGGAPPPQGGAGQAAQGVGWGAPPPPRGLIDRLAARLQRWSVTRQNAHGTDYATLHHRPKRAAGIGAWSEPTLAPPPMAVAMQGPVMAEDDFTFETLKLYARTMPGVRLVLSTWRDTPAALLAPIERLGVEVVLSDKPAVAGMFNVNLQIASASAGVRRAVEGGAEWVLKTRVDQRLYAPNAMAFLHAMATAFPVAPAFAAAAGGRQRARILCVGQGSMKYAPYHPTDQTVFGAAEDMLAYWTPPLRAEGWPAGWPQDAAGAFLSVPVGEFCRRAVAECYFASQFLERMGRPLDWSLADSWAAYRDQFLFVDYAGTDFFWVKGQLYSQREHSTRYDAVTNREEMLFRDWMLLWSGALDPAAAAAHEAAALAGAFNAPLPAPA